MKKTVVLAACCALFASAAVSADYVVPSFGEGLPQIPNIPGLRYCAAPGCDNSEFLDTHFGIDATTGQLLVFRGDSVQEVDNSHLDGQEEVVLAVAPTVNYENIYVPPEVAFGHADPRTVVNPTPDPYYSEVANHMVQRGPRQQYAEDERVPWWKGGMWRNRRSDDDNNSSTDTSSTAGRAGRDDSSSTAAATANNGGTGRRAPRMMDDDEMWDDDYGYDTTSGANGAQAGVQPSRDPAADPYAAPAFGGNRAAPPVMSGPQTAGMGQAQYGAPYAAQPYQDPYAAPQPYQDPYAANPYGAPAQQYGAVEGTASIVTGYDSMGNPLYGSGPTYQSAPYYDPNAYGSYQPTASVNAQPVMSSWPGTVSGLPLDTGAGPVQTTASPYAPVQAPAAPMPNFQAEPSVDAQGSPQFENAVRLVKENRFSEAKNILASETTRNPSNAAAWRWLADCQYNLLELDAAAASYQRALERDPNDYYALRGQGFAHLHRGHEYWRQMQEEVAAGQKDAAAQTFAQAHENYKKSLELLGLCLRRAPTDGEAIYGEAMAAEGASRKLYSNAISYLKLGPEQRERAELFAENCLVVINKGVERSRERAKQNPGDAGPRALLGGLYLRKAILYHQLGKNDLALIELRNSRDVQQSILDEIDKNNAAAQKNLREVEGYWEAWGGNRN